MGHRKWQIPESISARDRSTDAAEIIGILLKNRGLKTKKEITVFITPPDPDSLTPADVGIDPKSYKQAIARIKQAIAKKESIVVYADYDADGITAGAVMWDAVHSQGGNIMPYIPSRAEEGYGLSQKGIDAVCAQYHPTLLITVDHGITAHEKVEYAKSLGMDVIVSDHHVKPDTLPDCITVHTTMLSGSGISWFIARGLTENKHDELLTLATIGTIADMVPLTGPNRSIAKYGLAAFNKTKRVGLLALMQDAGLAVGELGTYDVSHILAPRLNAMGRLTHAMDALRLLCTTNAARAMVLARTLGLTNKERQQLTTDTTVHALDLTKKMTMKKLIFVSHDTYNPGIIGLVAGKLVEEYYRPAIVVSRGELISKASARSIPGFNIVEAIRLNSDILIDVGGHPMAAGFTVETAKLELLRERLEEMADRMLTEENLTRTLKIDLEMPLASITDKLWQKLGELAPFGFGNPEPVFSSSKVKVADSRLVGNDGKHLKLKVSQNGSTFDAIAFGLGDQFSQLQDNPFIDIAYTIDMNVWNGRSSLQLKIKDLVLPQ
jgi:single-stranded-DNA-specific exonuclease